MAFKASKGHPIPGPTQPLPHREELDKGPWAPGPISGRPPYPSAPHTWCSPLAKTCMAGPVSGTRWESNLGPALRCTVPAQLCQWPHSLEHLSSHKNQVQQTQPDTNLQSDFQGEPSYAPSRDPGPLGTQWASSITSQDVPLLPSPVGALTGMPLQGYVSSEQPPALFPMMPFPAALHCPPQLAHKTRPTSSVSL